MSKLRGEWVDPARSRITVREWAEVWFEAQAALKATTLSGYRGSLDKHVLPRWGSVRLVDVGHAELQSWVASLSSTLAPSTVRQVYLVMAGMLKYAVRDGRLSRNPAEGLQLPRVAKRRRGYLSHDQVHRLAAAAGEYGDVVLFLAYTGLRWGEMAALRVGRLDMLRRRMEVVEAVSAPRGELVWDTPKSGAGRSVPFPAFLAELLAERCAGKERDALVFTGPDGGVLRSNNVRRRAFAAALEAVQAADADFPTLTLHDLRHTAASLAVSAGANVKAVQRMLGHASAAMTLDVYADLFDDDLDAVAIALNDGAAAAVVGKSWAQS